MSVHLPEPIATTSTWALVDWLDRSVTSAPAVGGVATLNLDALDYNIRWQLTHVVVSCTSSNATQLRLYLDAPGLAGLRDGSSSGNFDVSDWAMGLMVPPSRALIAQWTGCADGDVGTLNLQANIYRLSGT